MLTWQQFFEAKEKADVEAKEEELHKDLDNDNEEGESEEHKKKVGCCEVCGKKDCTCGGKGCCKVCGKKDCTCCKTCNKSKKSCKC